MSKIILVLLFAQTCFGQTLLWEKTYGSYLTKISVIESFDYREGNYALATSFDGNSYGGCLIYADTRGDTIWTKKFYNPSTSLGSNYRNPVKMNNGKIYYMPNERVGAKLDTVATYLYKFDKKGNGNKLGTYIVDGVAAFAARDLIIEDNGNLTYFGYGVNEKLTGNQGGGEKFIILKVDSLGNKLYDNFYFKGDTLIPWLYGSNILHYGPNNYVMYGNALLLGHGPCQIIKERPNGDTVATARFLDTNNSDTLQYSANFGQIMLGSDGDFYVSGNYERIRQPRFNYPFVARLDTSLNLKWVKLLTKGVSGGRLEQLPDGSILLVGSMYSPQSYISFHKIAPDGTLLDSAKVFTQIDTGCNFRYTMFHPEDSTLSFAGALKGNAYLAKIDLKKFVVTGLNREEEQTQNGFSVSPNPSNGFLQVHGLQLGNLEIYDTQGALMKKQKIESPNQQINIQDLNTGTYLYRFSTPDEVRYGKIVKQ